MGKSVDLSLVPETVQWLLDEHNIKPGDWCDLAMVLVVKHYPDGPPKEAWKRGRPKKWTNIASLNLYGRVEHRPAGMKNIEVFREIARIQIPKGARDHIEARAKSLNSHYKATRQWIENVGSLLDLADIDPPLKKRNKTKRRGAKSLLDFAEK